MKDEGLRLALKLAFRMGQDYCFHADHEFYSYHKKADAIRAKFDQLVEETIKQALANDALDRMAENERELGIQMQPEPEPVAWLYIEPNNPHLNVHYDDVDVSQFPNDEWFPVYKQSKREWQGLTDDEICPWFQENTALTNEAAMRITRAIEAKLKEKNT